MSQFSKLTDGALKKNWDLLQSSYLVQLPLGLLLHSADVIHCEFNPLVDAAEQLSVEVGEQTLLHLDTVGGWGTALEQHWSVWYFKWEVEFWPPEGDNINAKTRQMNLIISYLLDVIFYSILKSQPLELHSDQLVGTHVWTVRVVRKFTLHETQSCTHKNQNLQFTNSK